MDRDVTLLRLDAAADESTGAVTLPPDLLSQAAGRLRVVALLYAFVFFMAGLLPMLLIPQDRALLFSSVLQWGPATVSILVALLVAWIVKHPRVSLSQAMTIGLCFEVAASYGIALAELLDPRGYDPTGMNPISHGGLSWVAVWTVLFTIVVPCTPRRALVFSLASVSSVPVTVLLLMRWNLTGVRLEPIQLFVWGILPYLMVVCMAYVGSRVVYALGREVKRARDLGSYHLEEKLGQGGMGEVWRASHRLLARPAAIKLMRPALQSNRSRGSTEDPLARFEREAQAIASLRSPHTVNLFDFGVAADGSFYYVMELLEGLDTDKLIRRFGPIPAERAVHLLRQVCHSLSEAESRQLVHRDIKPANIFLCRYGEEYDFVKVLDFGIVKASREPGGGKPGALTGDNVLPGTPAYMAPEQILGDAVDSRADIYSTGCVAYWFLTGHQVFEAPTQMGLLMHHTNTQPTPPSSRTELAVPQALDELVLCCLAKDPRDRPQSARELARRLSLVPGAEDWNEDRARAWWERMRP
jgi:serine/threonine-protein kinase